MKDIDLLISEAETYIYFFESSGNKEMEEHWRKELKRLLKIKNNGTNKNN
jgi:hypothetical protein